MAVLMQPWKRTLFVLLLCTFTLNSQARDSDFDDEMDEVTAEELQMQDIPVDDRIFHERWNDVPYDKSYFTYSDAQIREKWDYLMRGLKVPYPSADFIRRQSEKYPFITNEIKDFDGDFVALERQLLESWRAFFAGDFQRSRELGLELGAIGKLPALFSQVMYAMYLTERHSVKNMLLQDVANTARDYFDDMKAARNDPEMAPILAMIKLGYAYAIARIAEESPVPVIVARNYINIIKENAEEILEVFPDHPLGLAFLAGVDANIMRRVGRFTGRMTYGARSTTVDNAFERALELAGDVPIVHYELANAMIYMSRRRDLNDANFHLETAMRMQPEFSMDALDVMYSYKRLQEIRLYALNFRSFRDFERKRRQYGRTTDRNLTSVLSPPLTMDMLDNPEKYKLPPR